VADTSLIFNILARDKTRGTLSKVSKGMGTAFAGIGTAAAAAGAYVAVEFGQKSVEAFIDAQASQTKFEESLRKNDLGAYTAEIDELSQALALKTRFDDDATKSGAAVLANFGLTADQLKATLPLVQDYAAFTGKDMTSASKLLGKAFLGNTRALKDLGIAYKPTGDSAADMAAIMDLVNTKVGGFAEKEGKTAAGTAAILSNQLGEVQEQIGSYLVPALTTLGKWIIAYVIPAVSKLAGWFQANLLPVIQDVGSWIMGTFVPAVQSLAAAFMRDVWPAIQQVAAQVAENLAPAIASLAELWDKSLKPAFIKALPYIKEWLKYVGILIGVIAVVVSWIVGKLIPAIAGFIGKLIEVNSKVQEVVLGIRNKFIGLVDFVRSLPGKIGAAASGMWDGIKNSFRGALNWIISKWNNLSFSLPGVSIPGLGDIGGFTLNTPDIPGLYKGGDVTAGGLVRVGERGPELLSLPAGARVTPLDGKAGPAVHIENVNVIAAPGERLEESVPRAFRRTAFVLGMGAA